MLREAMKRAGAGQEPPISNQIEECEEFIARAEIWFSTTKFVSDLEDGRNRL